jgi:hypothetical protein
MITSFKKNFNHFLDEIISKGKILDSGGQVRTSISLTHTVPKVVLTVFESFKSKNLKKTK